jgi:hypothetical protein
MPAPKTEPDETDAFLASLGLRAQLPPPPDPGGILTAQEWGERLRIGLCHTRRLVREAADKAQPLPDGSRVVRLGRTYRIIAA